MALSFSSVGFIFPAAAGAVQQQELDVVFPAVVEQAQPMLKGFDISYRDGDRHILREMIDLDLVRITGTVVRIRANLLLRDSSGAIDDAFRGSIEVVVIADTAAAPPT